MEKNRQQEVLGELNKLNLIESSLLKELSDSLESIHLLKKQSSSTDCFDLIDKVPMMHQIEMINKVFGENFQNNAFFEGIDFSFIILLLDDIKMEHRQEGEYIYHVNQPSNHIFLILDGRVNCLLTRNLCLKTYTKGSYFGDFEFFRNSTCIFSARAEIPTILLKISTSTLEKALENYPETRLHIMRRTFYRYLSFKSALAHIGYFLRINMIDKYWRSELKYPEVQDSLNTKLDVAINEMVNKMIEFREQ